MKTHERIEGERKGAERGAGREAGRKGMEGGNGSSRRKGEDDLESARRAQKAKRHSLQHQKRGIAPPPHRRDARQHDQAECRERGDARGLLLLGEDGEVEDDVVVVSKRAVHHRAEEEKARGPPVHSMLASRFWGRVQEETHR